MSVQNTAPQPEDRCPIHAWCAVPHDTDPATAEHHGTPLTVGLPGGRELLSLGLADISDEHGPEAWAAGVDCADLTTEQLAELIGDLQAALPKLRAMHAALAASRTAAVRA